MYLGNKLAIAFAVSGANSEGLITAQFPADIAPVNGVNNRFKG